MKYLSLILVMLSLETFASPENLIPVEFHGKWASSLKQCNAEYPVEVFNVVADSITYWESFSKVVKTKYSNGILEVEFVESVEGDQYNIYEEFEIKNNGKVLIRHLKHGDFTSYRCEK